MYIVRRANCQYVCMYVWMDGWPPGLEMLIWEEHRFLMNSLYKSIDLEHFLALRVGGYTKWENGELLCMFGCMYGWIFGCMYGWVFGCMYGWIFVCMYVWIFGCMYGFLDTFCMYGPKPR